MSRGPDAMPSRQTNDRTGLFEGDRVGDLVGCGSVGAGVGGNDVVGLNVGPNVNVGPDVGEMVL